MSKESRKRRARDRIDVRLWENRAKKYDLLMWQFPYWNRERLVQLDRWEASRQGMKMTPQQEAYFIFLYTPVIHKGRKVIHKGRKK